MIEVFLGILFVAGYAVISFEHPLKINKTGTAVLLGVSIWTIYIVFAESNSEIIAEELSHHLASIAEILFFLMGAMTIVELIDTHKGFRIITNLIKTDSKLKLLWIISIITFFLSAILDNLTTSIVMVSLLKKLVEDKKERMVMASMVIIAANSGGAWSPIGDVTTTMLWIGNRVTASNIITELFLPSVVSLLIPLLYQSWSLKGKIGKPGIHEGQLPASAPFFE